MKNYISTIAITLWSLGQIIAQTYPTPTGFTLPAGKTIVVTYEVDVNANSCMGVPPVNISNQASVSGSNFTTVLTDEVAGAPVTPTLTPFGAFTLGNLVYNDANRDGDFDMGTDAGINGVLVNLYADDGDGVLDAGDGAPIGTATTMTVSGQMGIYTFNVCPGTYILEVAPGNFNSGGPLHSALFNAAYVSSPLSGAGDPDVDTDDDDDNGDPVSGFGVATAAFSLSANNTAVDFGFKTPTRVSVNEVTVTEGTGGFSTILSFSVERTSHEDAFSLTVNTSPGTATSITDYLPITNGPVSFTAGIGLSAIVNVDVLHDNIVEADETFDLLLSAAPYGVLITDGSGLGTISNDDNATLTLSMLGGPTFLETNSGTTMRTFKASLSAPVQGGFTVPFTTGGGTATAGSDYVDNDGTLTFAGTILEEQTWTVDVNGDMTVEEDETFQGALGMPSVAGVTVSGSPQEPTILNDDSAVVSFAGNVSQSEATTPQVFTVNLSNPVDVAVSMTVNTSNGSAETGDSDYTAVSGGTVTFPANSTTGQMVNVTVANDNKVETDETYNLTLSALDAGMRSVTFSGGNPTLGATGTIENNDNATLTLGAMITEDDEGQTGTFNRQFTVTLSNPVQGGFDVAYTTDDGTATTADNDYTDNDGSLTFAGTTGEVETITVVSNGDRNIENNETFSVTLGDITNTTLGTLITKSGSPKQFTLINDEVDWGDAPTAAQSGFASSYPTASSMNGASHTAVPGWRMGATIDGEDDGQPTATANGDGSDDDGVTLPAQLTTGTTASITVNVSQDGWLNAWVDFNRNGDWSELNEYVIAEYEVFAGNNLITFPVPFDASLGTSFARFRFSSEATLDFIGDAPDGEVEDYQVTINSNAISINNVTALETNSGTTTFSFTVSLTNPAPAGGVTFDIATADNTAEAGSDYVAKSLTGQTIAEGDQTYTFDVTVNGDVMVEDNETFFVNLSTVVGVGVANGQGQGTIDNDDMATITFTGGNSEDEAISPRTFTATLNAPVQGGFQVLYKTENGATNPAIAGSDYTDNDGMLNFAGNAGEMQSVSVIIANDNTVELDETFTVELGAILISSFEQETNISISNGTQTDTIANNDAATVALSNTSVTQAEAGGSHTYNVTLSNPVDVNVTLNFATSNNTATTTDNDYDAVNQTVTFSAGSTTMQMVNITVNDDNKVENNETFDVALSNLMAGGRNVSLGTAAGTSTINNDDSATLTLSGGGSSNELNSGTDSKTFTATLSAPVQDGFDVAYTTGSGMATAGTDYADNDGTLSFSGNAMETQTWTVDVNGDNTVELNEAFDAALGAISGTSMVQSAAISIQMSPQTWTITNDDAATVSIAADVTQAENLTPQAFNVTLSNPVDVAVTVDFSTTDGTATDADNDYEPLANQLVTFSANTTSQTVNVTVNNDAKVETDEVFNVSIGNLQNSGRNVTPGTTARTGTIANDDMATLTLTGGSSQTEGTSHTFTATLSHDVQDGFTVAYTTNDGTVAPIATLADNDYTDNDNTLTFTGTAGEFKNITVATGIDNKVELNETFTVALGTPSAANVNVISSPQTGTIANDDQAIISISNVSQAENLTPQVFNVTISNPVDVAVSATANTMDGTAAAPGDFMAILAQAVNFGMNSTAAQTVNVTIANENMVEDNETYSLILSSLSAGGRNVVFDGNGATLTGNGTINNDDSATITLSGGSSANEGNAGTSDATFTATVDNPVQGGFTAWVTTANGTANSPSDYAQSNILLTFNGTAGQFITVFANINGDTDVEPDETFHLQFGTLAMPNTVQITAPTAVQTAAIGTAGSPQTWTILNDDIDWGDAPNTYQTVAASGGPSHAGSNLRLGATNDGEADGQPTVTANGDGAQDDGVTLPAAFIASTTASITVNANAASKLDAWIDFNADGDFDLPGEQIFNNQTLTAGNNPLSFSMPPAVTQGNSFARFRLSSAGGLGVGGAASDGEVEDYQVLLINTQFSINDPVISEGSSGTKNLSFLVSRSSNASACSVDYAITGGTATTGDNDYQPLPNGMVNFTAGGAMSQAVNVKVIGDLKVELNETVLMTLSNPVNGNILDGSGTGTITNDDAATVTITSPSLTEGDAGTAILSFAVSLSRPSDANVSVDFATMDGTATVAHSDYLTNSGNLLFSPGQTTKEVLVTINGDCAIETNETFKVRLSNLVNNGRAVTLKGGGTTIDGIGTITNDDALPVLTCPASYSKDTDPGVCQASVTLLLPSTASLCGTSALEFRHRTVNAANVPTGPYSAYIPAANNTLVFALGKHQIEWRLTDGSGTSTCGYFLTIIDNELPLVTCKPLAIDLGTTGTASISPADVFDSGSDNCGTVNLVSVVPNLFECQNEGPNTVTLTVNDGNGKTNSCTATVTVAPFITSFSVSSDPESCSGASDGSITASASAPGGTLGYSINGGVNFQFSGHFPGLAPGTYTVIVRVFGVPALCEKTQTVTVGAGTASLTCFKDFDGDGFTDGQTAVGCTCPPGYVTAAAPGDCDDNDPLERPNQTWHKDTDNDGYSDGQTLVQCLKPSGYKHASQLTQTTGDCNDAAAAVNPGATEVCNGTDDDCDSEVDEGLGGQVYIGNKLFSTQAQLDAWPPCYEIIQGNVTITGATIHDLTPLSNIIKITGNLTIYSNPNTQFTSLDGLDNLDSVGLSLKLYYNFKLVDCCAIDTLLTNDVTPGNSIGGPVTIFFNGGAPCNSAASIMSSCPAVPLIAPPSSSTLPGQVIEQERTVIAGLDIFPNPAREEVTFVFERQAPAARFSIVDFLGRTVFEQELEEGLQRIDLDLRTNRLQDGIYLVVLSENGPDGWRKLTRQLVVQR